MELHNKIDKNKKKQRKVLWRAHISILTLVKKKYFKYSFAWVYESLIRVRKNDPVQRDQNKISLDWVSASRRLRVLRADLYFTQLRVDESNLISPRERGNEN